MQEGVVTIINGVRLRSRIVVLGLTFARFGKVLPEHESTASIKWVRYRVSRHSCERESEFAHIVRSRKF
jgi:hypothetical protein